MLLLCQDTYFFNICPQKTILSLSPTDLQRHKYSCRQAELHFVSCVVLKKNEWLFWALWKCCMTPTSTESSFDVWSLILQSHTGTSQDKRSGTYETEVPNTNSKDRRKLRENHAYLQLLLDFDKKALFSFVWSPYPINIHTCLSIDFDHPYSFPLLKKIGLTSYFRYPCLLGPSICRCLDPYLRYKGALTFFQPALDMQSQRVLALVPSAWDCLSTPKSG